MTTDNTDKIKILGTLQKLFARTKSNQVEEARTSAVLAIQMMEKYGLMPANTTLTDAELAQLFELGKAEGRYEYLAEIGRRGGYARKRNLSRDDLADIASMGGHARTMKLTAQQRRKIAIKAGKASGAARAARKGT